MLEGHEVIVVDNFFTGRKRNVEHWIGHENFELIHHDIVNPLFIEVNEIYHLASPASPPHYMYNPVKTIKTNTLGTINMLGKVQKIIDSRYCDLLIMMTVLILSLINLLLLLMVLRYLMLELVAVQNNIKL